MLASQELYKRMQTLRNNSLLPLSLVLMAFVMAGCVSQSKYESAVQETKAVKEERDALADNLRLLQNRMKELESQKKQLEETTQKLQATADYMKKTDKLYDDLVKELSTELDAKTIKIKEMKDGVNVNLSEAILFSSGSAELNKSGQDVIIKVSQKLKDIPHQVIVAGFTDNIPIRGSLTKKFPTNWELAGARAASVVRLLEKQGVDKSKLTAVSYGENQAVESNDTAEGRSQNRRIEIRMRPIE
ncbi:MAG: OmpA family protein [Gammaproteobacteria bacterium]